jgi:hypothetical protein
MRYADAAQHHMIAWTEAVDIETETGASVGATGRKQPFCPQQVLLRGNLEVLFRTHHKLHPQFRLFRHAASSPRLAPEGAYAQRGRGRIEILGGFAPAKGGPVEAGHNLPVLARALDAVGHRQSCDRPVCGVEARHTRAVTTGSSIGLAPSCTRTRSGSSGARLSERRQHAVLALGAAPQLAAKGLGPLQALS